MVVMRVVRRILGCWLIDEVVMDRNTESTRRRPSFIPFPSSCLTSKHPHLPNQLPIPQHAVKPKEGCRRKEEPVTAVKKQCGRRKR